MLGPLFSAVEVAREHLNRILDAAKIGVCTVVDTDVADCLFVAILHSRSGWLRKKNYYRVNAAFSYLSEVDPLLCRGLSPQLALSIGDKVFEATILSRKQLARCWVNS
jgi:hypothetical protein